MQSLFDSQDFTVMRKTKYVCKFTHKIFNKFQIFYQSLSIYDAIDCNSEKIATRRFNAEVLFAKRIIPTQIDALALRNQLISLVEEQTLYLSFLDFHYQNHQIPC